MVLFHDFIFFYLTFYNFVTFGSISCNIFGQQELHCVIKFVLQPRGPPLIFEDESYQRNLRVKIANCSRLHCLAIPRRDLRTKKTKPNVEKQPAQQAFPIELLREGQLLRESQCGSKKKVEGGGGGEKRFLRFPPPPPSFMFFLLLSQLSRRTSRGNACYAGSRRLVGK